MIMRTESGPSWTIYQGDCLDILPGMDAGGVDLIATDLPYGTTACHWDTVIPFAPMWAAVRHVLKPRGVFLTTASQPFTSALVMSNPDWFRHEWIWRKNNKTGALNAKFIPLKEHENIIAFSDAPARSNQFTDYRMQYYPQGIIEDGSICHGKHKASAMNNLRGNLQKDYVKTHNNYPTTIIEFDIPAESFHPTQKPTALYAYLIRTYSNPGETVLDCCMGSGTTGVAAIETGRRFIGIERDPGYYQIAWKRLKAAKIPLFVDEPKKREPTQDKLI